MTDIIIQPIDNLMVRLQCEPYVAYEVSEDFSFFVNGYKHMPAYKRGHWDGKIRMFNVNKREFYRGLIPRLIEWAETNDYTISFGDKERLRPQIPFDEKWIESWASYGKLKPKDYQIKAFQTAMRLNQALVLSPTGSGKSYICYLMVRYLLEHGVDKVLITVPTTSLVEQLTNDFKDYAVDWDVDTNVHKIYSGKEKTTEARVVISTWQSIYKLPGSWFKPYGAYICDEAHGADSKSITGIVGSLGHAPCRVGLTGTLDGTALHELEMLARFGPVVKATSTKELMDRGDLAPISIDCFQLNYNQEEIALVKSMDYDQEITFLLQHESRNKLLVNSALRSTNNTLMLFNYIERHGKILYDMLVERAEQYGKKIYYISGKVAVEDRERIRQILEKENNAILLASMGTMSTGVNVKNLHNLIFCHPYKAKIKTLQSIGRTIRQAAGKNGAKLIDVGDNLVYKKRSEKPNATWRHFIERLKIYDSEGFEYRIIKLDVK